MAKSARGIFGLICSALIKRVLGDLDKLGLALLVAFLPAKKAPVIVSRSRIGRIKGNRAAVVLFRHRRIL
jgi:hypothetical protein